GGGGRYDKIITNFIDDGNEYPAVGCSFGLDAILEVLKEQKSLDLGNVIDLFIVPLDTKITAFGLAYELRKRGVKVDLQYNERKLNKVLNSVDRAGIPYVLVLGEDEVKNKKISLKSFRDNKSYEFLIDAYDEIASLIKKN
ncbi:MAG: histidine--tRNA ligase, partial [Bacilli bacterium]|nr:histidine--tRNA ligase [Bacilli bacterium]